MRGMGWDGMEDNGKIVRGGTACQESYSAGCRPFEPSLRRNSGMFDTGLPPKNDPDGNVPRAKRPTATAFRMAKLEGSKWRGGHRSGPTNLGKLPWTQHNRGDLVRAYAP